MTYYLPEETYMCSLSAHGQRLPPGLDKVDFKFFMGEAYKKMDEYCPSGVEKCECLNAPGK